MAHEIEGVGNVEIGLDPKAKAEMVATLIRQDVKTGVAQPPGDHVKYVDKPGPDVGTTAWKSPSTLNADGKGNCNTITRAAAPTANASHVAVVPVDQPNGERVDHAFLIAEPKPGDKPLNIDHDGKVVGEIPAERIIDPNIKHGANGGRPLPAAVYQGASIEPIWPAHVRDLSHIHAPAAERAAEGNAYQGVERSYAPETQKGVKTAEVSHLAARVVTPPVDHVPRPLPELYPTQHPVLDETGKRIVAIESAGKRAIGFKPTLAMAEQYRDGIAQIAQGVNPAPIPGDPPITEEHKQAARGLHDHLMDLAASQRHPSAGGPDPEAIASLRDHVTKMADKTHPERDVRATQTAEIEAMIPGAVPDVIAKHLSSTDAYMADTPPPLQGRGGGIKLPREDRINVFRSILSKIEDEEEILPLYIEDDREQDLGTLGSAEWLALSEALASWCCGHPHDGKRREPPPRPGTVAPEPPPAPSDASSPNVAEQDPPLAGIWDRWFRGNRYQTQTPTGRWVNGRWEVTPSYGYGSGNRYAYTGNQKGQNYSGGTTRSRMRENAQLFTSPGIGNLGFLNRGSEVQASPNRQHAMFQGRDREWTYVTSGNRRGWTFTETVERDPRMGALWDWRWGGGYGWRRPVVTDYAFVDNARFRQAYAAVTAGSYTHYYRRLLLNGGTVHGYGLKALRAGVAARGLTLPDALVGSDPPLGGFGSMSVPMGGFRSGGGGYRNGYRPNRSWGGPVVVATDYGACIDPTDPNDPCYDPSLGGVGGAIAKNDAAEDDETGIQLPSWIYGEEAGGTVPSLSRALAQAAPPVGGCNTDRCNS